MGRQSSRIWYQQKDHKEMVTWNGSSFQYHDKAYIWTGSDFELVWEKLKGGLWFKKTDIYFYQRPAIIRNSDGSVKFFIDYNPVSQEFRRISPDGTEENIESTCFRQWDIGEPRLDFSYYFSYTDTGKMPVVGDDYRLTKNQDSWLPFSLYDMDNVTSLVRLNTLNHVNYRTPQGVQAWLFNELSTGFRWAESNGNYRGMGMFFNYGSQPITYYLRFALISIPNDVYEDRLYTMPPSYRRVKYVGYTADSSASLMIYSDFNSGSYFLDKNNGIGVISIFSSIGTDTSSGVHPAVLAYEYELPIQIRDYDNFYDGRIEQLDEGTVINYTLNGTEVEFYIIDIMCEDYVPFDFSTFEFHIMKHGSFDLESVVGDKSVNDIRIIGDGSYGHEDYLYITILYGGGTNRDNARYDIDNDKIEQIYHISEETEIDPEFIGYGVDKDLVIAHMMRNAPTYSLCEIVDRQPND